MATTTGDTDVAPVPSSLGWKFLSLTRIAIGFVFLWAFLDKLLALGFHTGKDDETGVVDYFGPASWIGGGHVTEGYLVYGGNPDSPFHEFFVNLGAERWTDWGFMFGLLAVGVALMLGIGSKLGAWGGTALLVFMYMTQMLPANNPFLDDHIVYSLAIIGIVFVELGRQDIGLGKWWRKLPIVQKNSWLV